MRRLLHKNRGFPCNSLRQLSMTILVSLLSIGVWAQVVEFSVKNMTVREAIEKLQADYGYSVSVKVNDLDMERKVTIDARGRNILDVVREIFAGQNVDCAISGSIISVKKSAPVTQSPQSAQQTVASRIITGRVLDENHGPIMGASVILKGTQVGRITTQDGSFSLPTTQQTPILVANYLGHETMEVTLRADQTSVEIVLPSSATSIDDVVVVGYGYQKKINLTGSVSSITLDESMVSRNVSALSSLLAGAASGLSAIQNSGMAGGDEASLMVRGIGTVNDASPLIVVDDMPDVDINMINMNDVESISVLKDATAAAVYGSRGANGVILITTKNGSRHTARTTVNISHAWERPINPYSFMDDYARVMTLYRQVAGVNTRPGLLTFKEGSIDTWLAMQNIDPLRYPSTDWWDIIMRNGNTTNYNVSLTGSNDRSKFYASMGVMDKVGLQINNDYVRYNGRFNFEYKVHNNITVEAKFDGSWGKQKRYDNTGFGNEMLQTAIAGMTPYDPVTGRYGGTMAYGENIAIINPFAVFENCVSSYDRHIANVTGIINWTPIKYLTLRADYFLNYYNYIYSSANTPVQAYNFQTNRDIDHWYVPSTEGVHHNTENGYKTMCTTRATYTKKFSRNHNLSLLALYSEEFWWRRYQNSYREDNLHPSLSALDSTLPAIQRTSGYISEEGLQSIVGRLNYEAYNRYLLEANIRIDASSKFRQEYRQGYFPSVSFGWLFSEEGFIKKYKPAWFYSGKLRISYGSLGNNSGVGLYEQRETLTTRHYISGSGEILPGFVNMKMINRDLSWESTRVVNVGADLGFFNNTLTLEADYYDRLTIGMIRPSDISYLILSAINPEHINIGELRNRGIEFTLKHKGRINNSFLYNITGTLSHNASRLEKWNEPYYPGYAGSGGVSGVYPYVNMPWGYVYGYKAIGMAQTWDDIYKNTPQSGSVPGDILREDVNGDGQITTADRVAYPKYMNLRPNTDFSLGLKCSWKGIDLSLLLAGSTGRWDYWVNAYNNTNFSEGGYATSWLHWNDAWNANNRSAHMPRLGAAANVVETSYWLENMAFVRLKNTQLGYNLQGSSLKKLGISNIRVYLSGENLFTITKYRGMDPEKIGNRSDTYPQIKSLSMGITMNL